MAGHDPQYLNLPADFSGRVRLFPLPNLVMFPGVVQPLHVFEPRYVEMLEDALEGDKLIAMALLEPGWEPNYEGRPQLAPFVCIGRVVSHARSEKGTYNLLLLGCRRARIARELPPTRSFREAEVTLLGDEYSPAGAARRGALQQRLVDSLRPYVSASAAAQQQFQQLLASDISLGQVTDIVAHTLDLAPADKLRLLGECNVDLRAELLLEMIESLVRRAKETRGPPGQAFPPDFSDN
jgi:ATP-dependent Lon protease